MSIRHILITVSHRLFLVFDIMAAYSSSLPPLDIGDVDLGGLRGERRFGLEFVELNGFFYPRDALEGLKAAEVHFQPRPDDVFLCGSMKTGTTWLKALAAAILTTGEDEESESDVLRKHNPHQLVPNLLRLSVGASAAEHSGAMPLKPRVLQTHLPYSAIPPRIRSMGCGIIYVARNPKDTVISYWQFIQKLLPAVFDIHGADTSLEAVFEAFCGGVCHYGPFCDHVLSFWNAAKENPNIVFLNYEDMKGDRSASYVRRIAEFLGRTSLTDEEIERIHGRCSFERLSALDVNRNGKLKAVRNLGGAENKLFFRKGEVGDWKNYFSAEMNSRLESIVEEKLEGSDFCFRYE